MGRIVMKFGGTSVSTAERIISVADIILSAEKQRPLVVVSAVGVAEKGEAKITDQLEAMAALAQGGKPYQTNLKAIRVKHQKILKELKLDWELISPTWDKLIGALKNTDRPYCEFLDEVFSFGERLSSRIMAAVLEQKGQPSRCVEVDELGIVTNENFQDAIVPVELGGQVLADFRDEERI